MVQLKLNKLKLIFIFIALFKLLKLSAMEDATPKQDIQTKFERAKRDIIIDTIIKFAPNLEKSQLEQIDIKLLRMNLLVFLIENKPENRLEAIETMLVLEADATYALELAIEKKDLAVARLAVNGPKEIKEPIRKHKVLEKFDAEELKAINNKRKANVNDVLDNGDTLLIRAIKSQMPEMVDLLIKSGADIRKTDKSGYTPIQIANIIMGSSMFNTMEIPNLLYAAGIKGDEGRIL